MSSSNSEPWEVKSLLRTFKDLNHFESSTSTSKSITILKIDVEGAEWDALTSFLYDHDAILKIKNGFIKQLLIEWHWDPDSRYKHHSTVYRTLLLVMRSTVYQFCIFVRFNDDIIFIMLLFAYHHLQNIYFCCQSKE